MPGLASADRDTGNLARNRSLSRSADQMCHRDSRIYLSPEEAAAAEESLSIYCKPVELYNILQRRASRHPLFLQRCLRYKIQAKRQRRYSLASLCSKAMSLACLACHCMDSSSESFRRYSTSDSDSEGRCGARMNCWSRKTPVANPEIANSVMTSRVAPQPAATSQGSPGSPRLIRCHAVRRDIFRDWHFDETIEEGQRLWQ